MLTEFMRAIQFDTLFQNRTFVFAHSDAYVGLFTTDPGDAGDQSGEVSAGEYNRVQPTWTTVDADTETIVSTVSFAEATSTWGTITHVGLLDASSGGNMLAYEPVSFLVESGDQVVLDPDKLTATVTFDTGTGLGEDTVYAEYRQKILLESVLHGGTLGPHQSFAGLNGSQTGDGSPGSFISEPDPAVAVGYARLPMQWAAVGSNPLQISNVNELAWVVQNVDGATNSWKFANRAVMLVNDGVPRSSSTRGWYRINGATLDPPSPGETLKIAAGALVLTF